MSIPTPGPEWIIQLPSANQTWPFKLTPLPLFTLPTNTKKPCSIRKPFKSSIFPKVRKNLFHQKTIRKLINWMMVARILWSGLNQGDSYYHTANSTPNCRQIFSDFSHVPAVPGPGAQSVRWGSPRTTRSPRPLRNAPRGTGCSARGPAVRSGPPGRPWEWSPGRGPGFSWILWWCYSDLWWFIVI